MVDTSVWALTHLKPRAAHKGTVFKSICRASGTRKRFAGLLEMSKFAHWTFHAIAFVSNFLFGCCHQRILLHFSPLHDSHRYFASINIDYSIESAERVCETSFVANQIARKKRLTHTGHTFESNCKIKTPNDNTFLVIQQVKWNNPLIQIHIIL